MADINGMMQAVGGVVTNEGKEAAFGMMARVVDNAIYLTGTGIEILIFMAYVAGTYCIFNGLVTIVRINDGNGMQQHMHRPNPVNMLIAGGLFLGMPHFAGLTAGVFMSDGLIDQYPEQLQTLIGVMDLQGGSKLLLVKVVSLIGIICSIGGYVLLWMVLRDWYLMSQAGQPGQMNAFTICRNFVLAALVFNALDLSTLLMQSLLSGAI